MSKLKTIAVSEVLRAIKYFKENGGEFIYSPKYSSKNQEDFYRERFAQIKQHVNAAFFAPNKKWQSEANCKVFCWDSYDEKITYKNQLALGEQNRLFDKLSFDVPNSFTGFRKKAEQNLPDIFEEFIKPIDQDVIRRIQHYFYETKLPASYFETRNGMVNSDDASGFSIYLSCGALDVRYLYNEIKKYEHRNGSNKSTYWLVFELLWREFFYWHYQKCGVSYFSENGINGPLNFSEINDYSFAELRAMSDSPFWQASLNELEMTGQPMNRTRQMFASFWINDLNLEWRSGAVFYERQLLDYDVYSNWGNWMYLAGVGVDSRGPRRFNIESQLQRYDPKGEYFAKWA